MNVFLRNQEQELQVWPSYTDVALNVILILLFYLFAQAVISSQTSAAMFEIKRQQEELKQKVNAEIPADLRHHVKVIPDGNLQRFTFANQVLFESGKAELKETGKRILEATGRVFQGQVGKFTKIQIEGHTDNQNINTVEYRSNWELSSARATTVVRFLEDTCGLDPRLLSATGYSQHQPVDRQDSEEGRARNRRIELVVVYSVNAAPARGAAAPR